LLGNVFQRFQRIIGYVGSVIFSNPYTKKPSITLVGRDQSSGSSGFATTGKTYAFFDDPTTQISIYQALGHFDHGSA